MIKKENIAILSIIVLSLAFIIVSMLVYFNSKNSKLISSKIKLGALILTITTAMYSCGNNDDDIIMCYAQPVDTNYIYTEDTTDLVNENIDSITTNQDIVNSNIKVQENTDEKIIHEADVQKECVDTSHVNY